MSQLFIRVYLDEDVDVLIAELLKARGFEAFTTRESGQSGNSDTEQMEYAVAHRLTIFSHNRVHFEAMDRLFRENGRKHLGMIIAARRSPYSIARRLLAILNRVTAEEIEGLILYM